MSKVREGREKVSHKEITTQTNMELYSRPHPRLQLLALVSIRVEAIFVHKADVSTLTRSIASFGSIQKSGEGGVIDEA
jgi:hypothetical protein